MERGKRKTRGIGERRREANKKGNRSQVHETGKDESAAEERVRPQTACIWEQKESTNLSLNHSVNRDFFPTTLVTQVILRIKM